MSTVRYVFGGFDVLEMRRADVIVRQFFRADSAELVAETAIVPAHAIIGREVMVWNTRHTIYGVDRFPRPDAEHAYELLRVNGLNRWCVIGVICANRHLGSL